MTEMSGEPEVFLAGREMSFVLHCLQGRFDARAVDDARILSSQTGFDWGTVRVIGQRERLSPLLYNVTKDVHWVPSAVAAEFRRTYLDYAVHNAGQLRNLAKVIDLFALKGLGVLVLKGAALAETIYRNIALRPMTDLDVLVKESDVSGALNILQTLGYMSVDAEAHPGMITAYENEILLYRHGKIDAAIELHWSLLDSPHYQDKIEMDWFWETAVFAQIGYAKSRVLGAEALLLHLCAHLSLHHSGWGLLWLHDIAELLFQSGQTLNWQIVCEKAGQYDLVLPLQRVIPLVNDKWRLMLEPELLEQLASLAPSARERQVFEWLATSDRSVGQRFVVDLVTASTWKERIRYAWRSLIPTPSYMRQRYEIDQGFLLPLYYPYRWLLGLASLLRRS